jgi:hypothetical protein
MAFLKCVSAYGAEGVPGQYLERNLLCDTIGDINGLFGANNTLVKSDLNGTCPSVCVGDVFNVFVKNRDNDTFRSADNKFRPELVDNWETTNMRLTCVYVKRDEYSDKLDYALFIPHAKGKIIQPLIASGDKPGILPYNNSLFSSVYVVNVGANSGGGDTVSVNGVNFDFKNKEKFKYIICSVKQANDHGLTVTKSNINSDLLFCAVVDTKSDAIPVAGDVVVYDITGDLKQPDDFVEILPYAISPKGVLVEIYPYDETKDFSAKPIFQLKMTDNDKTVICDDVLAGKYKPITKEVVGHHVFFLMKTAHDDQCLATVRVHLYA